MQLPHLHARSFWLALGVVMTLGLPARAQPHVELVGRVTASRTVLGQRRVGKARYVAISDLFYRDQLAIVEILDLATRSVVQVKARRATLERRFGSRPQAEIVLYRNGVVGLAVQSAGEAGARHYWYAELDAQTGKLVRSVDLAMLGEGNLLEIIGADPVGGDAWFAITEVVGRRTSVVLRRLELGSLEVHDEQRVALIARGHGADREHAVTVHAAADFSQFAIVEYVERAAGMPPGHVYVVDRSTESAAGTTFHVEAPPTAYGVAFAPDHRYIYLGSAQLGTISRIDVAGRRIDKQVAAPHYLHHLVISPGGTLFAFASSNTYAVYDLPHLKTRHDAAHPAGVAPAMVELHGNGVASLDGAFFVVPDVEDRKHAANDRSYVIARLVD
ncbi:MAG TPA: hypothetical protein VH165_10320 [Kofleriaceae bacterium]|nr:hypothetical protein [Kofleriaceae bacterium]